jgi:hypothetical protein
MLILLVTQVTKVKGQVFLSLIMLVPRKLNALNMGNEYTVNPV